jgi:Na+/H+ antiporter NhaA
MSLFIATLSFGASDGSTPAKVGVLLGSLVSGVAGTSDQGRDRS